MDLRYLGQFKIDPIMGYHFDAICYKLACAMVKDFQGGLWGYQEIGTVKILLLPESLGDRITLNNRNSGQSITTDRLTASLAFCHLLNNWFWNANSDQMSDESNQAFHDDHFGIRDLVWSDKKNELNIDRDAFHRFTD